MSLVPPPVRFRVLSLAAKDSSTGAGVDADMKTFHALGAHAEIILTAITEQSSRGVTRVQPMLTQSIIYQLAAIDEVEFCKTGLIPTRDMAGAIAISLKKTKLIVDPVLHASSGGIPLTEPDLVGALATELLPRAYLVTPNIAEARALIGNRVEPAAWSELTDIDDEEVRELARRVHDLGVQHVLITGGHNRHNANDLHYDGQHFTEFPARRLDGPSVHGTGCVFSAAIAALLTLQPPLETNLLEAIQGAKDFTRSAIEHQKNGNANPDWKPKT